MVYADASQRQPLARAIPSVREGLEEHSSEDLDRLLGLDRAPALRRKLARLAPIGGAIHFGRLLAERRVAACGAAIGFPYVDGRARVYHGQCDIPKAHVAPHASFAAGDPLLREHHSRGRQAGTPRAVRPMSSAHRTRAIARHQFTAAGAVFLGRRLRLTYGIADYPDRTT